VGGSSKIRKDCSPTGIQYPVEIDRGPSAEKNKLGMLPAHSAWGKIRRTKQPKSKCKSKRMKRRQPSNISPGFGIRVITESFKHSCIGHSCATRMGGSSGGPVA